MYQKFIKLSDDSYIEVTSRLFNQGESVVLALRGTKDNSQPAIASVIMEISEVESVAKSLQEALEQVSNDDKE